MNESVHTPARDQVVTNAAQRLHSAVIVLLLLLVVVRLLLPALRDDNFGIVSDADRGGWSSDFAAILTFAQAFWHGEAGYDIESYLRVTSARVGRPVEHALPFPYSPTMLWILGPFCVPPAAWSYVLWSLLSIAAVWWMTRPPQSIWLIAAFFTPVTFSCFKLGQTALLTTAGLLFLMRCDLHGRLTSRSLKGSEWLDAMVLWALTAKPPVALTAAAALVIGRRWRALAFAAGLTILSTALLTPLLGTHWVQGYLYLVTHYDLDTADPVYVWSLAPQTMGNLRALLHVTLGIADSIANSISSGLWLFALAGIVVAGLRGALTLGASWALAVLAYLLFCPHVTSTEELQLALVLTLFVDPQLPMTNGARWLAVGLVLVALFLAPGLGYRGPLRLPAVFATKVVLAILVVALRARLSPAVGAERAG